VGLSEVDLVVRHIHIPKNNDRLPLLQFLHVVLENRLKLFSSKSVSLQLHPRSGIVDVNHEKIFILESDHPSLKRVLWHVWKILNYRNGLVFGEDGHS
jgi:hypothetical protein